MAIKGMKESSCPEMNKFIVNCPSRALEIECSSLHDRSLHSTRDIQYIIYKVYIYTLVSYYSQ